MVEQIKRLPIDPDSIKFSGHYLQAFALGRDLQEGNLFVCSHLEFFSLEEAEIFVGDGQSPFGTVVVGPMIEQWDSVVKRKAVFTNRSLSPWINMSQGILDPIKYKLLIKAKGKEREDNVTL